MGGRTERMDLRFRLGTPLAPRKGSCFARQSTFWNLGCSSSEFDMRIVRSSLLPSSIDRSSYIGCGNTTSERSFANAESGVEHSRSLPVVRDDLRKSRCGRDHRASAFHSSTQIAELPLGDSFVGLAGVVREAARGVPNGEPARRGRDLCRALFLARAPEREARLETRPSAPMRAGELDAPLVSAKDRVSN